MALRSCCTPSKPRPSLGQGSLVELIKPNRIRLLAGELRVAATAKSPVKLLGPKEQEVTVKGAQRYRLQEQALVRLEKDPLWLQGFEGSTANESIGSLVAKVEGRNVPLTVGYHKVTVDIRDQIARTVIEESFVNHTDGRLEGVFHFPLPQDASISGFGMWIGDELVEADVVEKQRAREISMKRSSARSRTRDCWNGRAATCSKRASSQELKKRILDEAGEHAAVKEWLDRVLNQDFEWFEHEEESLRSVYTNLLRSQGRYPELVDHLAEWVKRKPDGNSAYRQYLGALIWAGREDEANALIAQWLKEAQTPGRLAPDVAARLEAAVWQALGQGYNLWTDRIDEQWLTPLAQAVLFFARHESQLHTADRIMGHHRFQRIGEVRNRAESEVDQRALDLLEALVKRRASEVLNQPGPHVDAALAALQRAFQRDWTEGEPRLMADFLAGLGAISQSKLAGEQIRELQLLDEREAPGSLDRLHVAHALARGLWSCARRDEAIDLMEAAQDEFEDASGGVLPAEGNEPLSTFVSYLEQQGHHARGEQVLLEHLKHLVHQPEPPRY